MTSRDDDVSHDTQHWSRIQESGTLAGMRLMVWIRRRLGRWPFRLMLVPVIAYYYVVRHIPRQASQEYLKRIWPLHAGHAPRCVHWLSLRHFLVFGSMLMDKIDAWSGRSLEARVDGEDRARLDTAIRSGRGGLVLVSHVGNLEICSAMQERRDDFHVVQIMHTRNASKFNELLARSSLRRAPEIIEVSEITPATAMLLAERIQQGRFVMIAADRVPIHDDGRTQTLDFLGAPAAFPEGPFHLATLLRCPLYTVACLRDERGYRVEFDTFDDTTHLRRAERDAWREQAMRRYVAWLTEQCRRQPLQWFNFFPFWSSREKGDRHDA
ncbi:LpxL/LpxP family acyltransferase [Chromohalobacter israelensis]|jgi:predicted LPLAT superfamily acyltransferase|uniref:LpxL/LpxP family acyltransferase n=1 Tax=Chromohalobacter israelensis TaxID=141390 RepID=UPI000558A822|nr:glycosyl transferase [Chromohalobacter israelensis]MDF9434019.1 glycosyl transferase [Chromohalobacter israelensis]